MRCRSDEMRLFLRGESSPEQSALIESHLSDCESCQAWVDEHAAPVSFWSETAAMLGESVDFANPNEPVNDFGATDLQRGSDRQLTAALSHRSIDANQRTAEMSDADTSPTPMTEQVLLGHIKNWCDPVDDGDLGIGRLGKYLVDSIVGHGGMGVVLRATDTDLGRPVAIKTLLQPIAVHSVSRDRLVREARAVASLDHEHIIDMYSIEQWRDVPYIVMPFVNGGTLGQHAERRTFDCPEILDVARQLASALAVAHQSGLIHRDIKPSNILLANGLSHVVLADFGLARTDEDFTVTQSGMAPGTPQWMSPEQATVAAIDHRSDQFSLGSVLYWMTTQRYPFDSDSCYATLMNLVNQDPRPIIEFTPEAPRYLVALIERMMSKNPDDRFDDMGQVVALTSQCLQHYHDSSIAPPQELIGSSKQPARRWMGIGPSQLTIIIAFCFVGVLAAATASQSWSERENDSPAFSHSAPNNSSTPADNDSPIAETNPQNSSNVSQATDAPAEHAPTELAPTQMASAEHSPAEHSPAEHSPAEHSPAEHSPAEQVPSAPQVTPIERYGPLDEIERTIALDQLRNGTHELYWLRRLAYLDAEQIPAEMIPPIMQRASSDQPVVAELVRVILAKNPFVEIEPIRETNVESPSPAQSPGPTEHTDENPFVVVDDE